MITAGGVSALVSFAVTFTWWICQPDFRTLFAAERRPAPWWQAALVGMGVVYIQPIMICLDLGWAWDYFLAALVHIVLAPLACVCHVAGVIGSAFNAFTVFFSWQAAERPYAAATPCEACLVCCRSAFGAPALGVEACVVVGVVPYAVAGEGGVFSGSGYSQARAAILRAYVCCGCSRHVGVQSWYVGRPL